jgi:hypothetical protein
MGQFLEQLPSCLAQDSRHVRNRAGRALRDELDDLARSVLVMLYAAITISFIPCRT